MLYQCLCIQRILFQILHCTPYGIRHLTVYFHRAIAKDPEIFIFDDSFSALDFKTDSQLRKALKEYTKDATTVIVAQRISTILGADQIIVLDDGHMAGIGTHKELMANCEVYQQIARSQLSEEELA